MNGVIARRATKPAETESPQGYRIVGVGYVPVIFLIEVTWCSTRLWPTRHHLHRLLCHQDPERATVWSTWSAANKELRKMNPASRAEWQVEPVR
jgi:hypothetical protein